MHELKHQLEESQFLASDLEAKVDELETQRAEDTSRRVADDAALGNFSYISAYVDVLQAVLHRDASTDISVLLEDFKAYVAEYPPEANIILPVADLADFGVDLAFLGQASRLT